MMFSRIAIIGVGLIGGSLALALKKAGAVKTIVGCDPVNGIRAKELGIIDEAEANAAQAVKGAEIVVLCTPLSTYRALAAKIAPHLAPGAILTDVGSVKTQPSQDIWDALSPEQQRCFVPGHPIAGTEKSGPDAAFMELFGGKNVLLTEYPYTHDWAHAKIEAMWKAAGARVTNIDVMEHDKIYAHVSHSIQALCSAYGVMLSGQSEARAEKAVASPSFQSFLRLCGSDVAMWRDIFHANGPNVAAYIGDFLKRWDALAQLVMHRETQQLEAYLAAAQDQRKKARKEASEIPLEPVDPECVYTRMIPLLVAAPVMDSMTTQEYDLAIGAGFRGFTKCLLAVEPTQAADTIIANSVKVSKAMQHYRDTVNAIGMAIDNLRQETLESLLREGQKTYQALYRTASAG